MAKATVPGNTAVAGITGTSTTKATTSLSGTNSTASKTASSSGSSSSSTKTSSSSGTSSSSSDPVSTLDEAQTAAALAGIVNASQGYVSKAKTTPVNTIDVTRQVAALKTQEAADKANAAASIDYGTTSAVKELTRNLEDSKSLYQTQRNQTDADEAKALDNQALYAEARGDKGGIGQAQYGSIQNTAANERTSINSAETKLLTDTSRQIADLQAKGEYEKADKIAEISKSYLQELNDLQQWAQEQNIGVEEFNSKLREWEQEYDLDVAQYLTDTELDAAKALISAGITPSERQLNAVGWTLQDAWAYQMANRNQASPVITL